MHDVKKFVESFKVNGVTDFVGVPDSLLKPLCTYLLSEADSDISHQITANEGSAIALAAGKYVASRKPCAVYLQNSGFGNCVNPLLSLASSEVYGIPMVLIIGWRGEPGVKDEPQHIHQGRVMEVLCDAIDLPFTVIDAGTQDVEVLVQEVIARSLREKRPAALLVKKGTFSVVDQSFKVSPLGDLSREDAIHSVLSSITGDEIVVSTTGMASRELFEARIARGESHGLDFLTVGSMGHSLMIAQGIATGTSRTVICLDGDGSALMHLGNMPIVGEIGSPNLIHIILNNGAHDSVGGQPTAGGEVEFCDIAKASGYYSAESAVTQSEIQSALSYAKSSTGPTFIEIKIATGSRKDLGRPTSTPKENLENLIREIASD